MFQQIDRNKNYSILLVAGCAALLMVVGYFIGRALGLPWYLGLIIAGGLAIILSLVSYFGGGKIVLSMSGARKVQKREHPQLINVVEEMSIAAGMPMPDVYVIDDTAPNAFATGRKPEEAAVAVTSGLLSKLSRDELQGVIAHEIAHIRNFDILFMMMMAVMVGTIALLCDGFLRSMWYGGRSRGRGRGGGNAIFLIIALLLAILAPLAAKLIQLAASRRREYLADASGALLTRYPAGLASALRKISSDPEPLEVANRATQHLYIVNPMKAVERRAAGLLSTHPPIEERIQRLSRMAYMDESDASRSVRAYATPTQPAAAGAQTTPVEPPRPPIPIPVPVPGGSSTPVPTEAVVAGAAGAALVGEQPGAAEEARISGPDACPRCHETLVRAKLTGKELRACRACGGLWMNTGVFADLVQSVPHRLIAADDRWPNLIGVGWNRVGPKRCPQCGVGLGEAPVKGVEDVKVDRCMQCDGVWFDDGELAAVVSAAQSRGTAGTA
ncbi:MAG: M48 family metalloprotease [Armatimonadota bacterium]|jgi:heat shock protein HtpX